MADQEKEILEEEMEQDLSDAEELKEEETEDEEPVSKEDKKAAKKQAKLNKKEDSYKEKIDQLEDRVKRQMAEFENFRKRTDKEKQAMFDTGAKSVIEKILPVVDNFERGLATVPEESKEDPFVDGMNRIYKQLMTELENIGVKPIEAVGQEFDPNLHNAVPSGDTRKHPAGPQKFRTASCIICSRISKTVTILSSTTMWRTMPWPSRFLSVWAT